MKFFSKAKDGGPDSPVDAFFLFEIKPIGSIAILRFNQGAREAFHTHAFNALTWFICGDMVEETIDGSFKPYRRSLLPKFTPRVNNHRVRVYKTSWCLTIRGPWRNTWTEDTEKETLILTHGRKVLYSIKKK